MSYESVPGEIEYPYPYLGTTIDCFAAPGALSLVVPARGPGIFVAAVVTRAHLIVRGGTLTGLPTFKLGTNAGHDNYAPTVTFSPTLANINAVSPPQVFSMAVSGLSNNMGAFVELTAPLYLELVTAATGAGASLSIRPLLFAHLSQP